MTQQEINKTALRLRNVAEVYNSKLNLNPYKILNEDEEKKALELFKISFYTKTVNNITISYISVSDINNNFLQGVVLREGHEMHIYDVEKNQNAINQLS